MATPSTERPPHVNKGPAILIACGICVGVALVMVLMRVVVRLKVLRNIGPDDHCILAAMVSTIENEGNLVIMQRLTRHIGRDVRRDDGNHPASYAWCRATLPPHIQRKLYRWLASELRHTAFMPYCAMPDQNQCRALFAASDDNEMAHSLDMEHHGFHDPVMGGQLLWVLGTKLEGLWMLMSLTLKQ